MFRDLDDTFNQQKNTLKLRTKHTDGSGIDPRIELSAEWQITLLIQNVEPFL